MPKALRVLHVIGDLQLGGAETILYRLATTSLEGIEQEVICLGERDWYSSRLEERGIPVHHLGMTSGASTIARLGSLRALLRERRPDVIQSWMYLANVVSSLAATGLGVPVIWGIHASTFEHLGWPSRLCAYGGGLAARQLSSFVINCSEHSAKRHAGYGYAAVANAVIPNGYDSHAFYPDEERRARARTALRLHLDEFVVGSVSRWHSEKDVPTLLAALAPLNVRCVLVGPDLEPSNTELSQAIGSYGLGERVLALGRRDDIGDLLRAMDLHILSSRSEAFPNVVAESMVSGTPNIVTDVGDAGMMVGDSGWIVPAQDPGSLATALQEAITEFSDEQTRWQARQVSARKRITEHFSFDRMVSAYEEVWRQLASKS